MIENKYRRWHDQIIDRARVRSLPDVYVEKHHVTPRSLGGSNGASNIVRLTYREHFLVHWLLTKMTSGEARKKMCLAMSRMCIGGGNRTSRSIAGWQYETSRKIAVDGLFGNKFNVGKKRTQEQRKAISAFMTGNRFALGYKHTDETKQKLSIKFSGQPKSPEHIEKVRLSKIGHRHSDETKQKLRRPKSEETKQKLRLANLGKHPSEESRAKMRGKRGPRSLETRRRMSEAAQKREAGRRNGAPPAYGERTSRIIKTRI